jgi:hypothetical protein
MYETPESAELFYVHHARNNTQAERALYTTRMALNITEDEKPKMKMYLTTSDQPLPRGTTPISINVNKTAETKCTGRNIIVELSVLAASGASFELAEASNRVVLRERDGEDDLIPLYSTLLEDGKTSLVLFRRQNSDVMNDAKLWYQRHSHLGSWQDIVGVKVACS